MALMGAFLGLISCNKEKIQQFIYAGENSGDYLTYVEIDPPAVLNMEYPSTEKTHRIDIDKDGETDLTFTFVGSGTLLGHLAFDMKVTPGKGTEICSGSEATLAAQLSENRKIDENLSWANRVLTMHSYNYTVGEEVKLEGDWIDPGTSYIGFRKKNKRIYQYGWVEVKMDVTGISWVVSSYAYIHK